jgi:hypothetical protein
MQTSRIHCLLPLAALTLMLAGEATAQAQSSLLPSLSPFPPPMAFPLIAPQPPTAAPDVQKPVAATATVPQQSAKPAEAPQRPANGR